ncbi:tail fiber protein, partial [Campylobacter sp. RM12635]|nr:tail fiber protein [Campylobacter sp. RM12635]
LDENTASLTNIKYENLPTSVRIDEFDNSKIILEAVLRNDTAQDFFINCVGFVAKNRELLCFTKIKRTPVLSKATDTNASLFHYKLAMELKHASELSIKIDETIVYPTLAHFNTSQKAQDELIAKLGLDKVNISDFTASQNLQDDKIKTLENTKADKAALNNYYTKTETYTKAEIDKKDTDKYNALNNTKADKAALNNYYTKTETYTKAEIDKKDTDKYNALNNTKADKTTTYTKAEVDNSQTTQNTTISTNHTSVLNQLALQNTQMSKLMTQCQNLLTKIELGGGKVGMIFMYAGATIPSNYMLCDGRELLKTAYPQLFSAIGTIYGESADKLKFKIPDLRGRFVRCVGGNAAALGVSQGDAIRNITASIFASYPIFTKGVGAFVKTNGKGDDLAQGGSRVGNGNSYVDFNASRVVPTANENRPINMSMNFIIQIKE